MRDKGYEVIACEPNVNKEEVDGFKLYSLEEILKKADYLVLAQGHRDFKENMQLLKAKKIYDCLGIIK